MISHIEGKVLHIDLNYSVIAVGGLGYKVSAAPETLSHLKLGQTASLWIHNVIREDADDLYGFIDRDSLAFFELLIGISGIGPKTAIGIMSLATVKTLKSAIASGEPTQLTKISGIGKKNAEKIVLELKDKIDKSAFDPELGGVDDTDTMEALKSLGYQEREIRDVIKKIPQTIKDPGKRVTEALKKLGK